MRHVDFSPLYRSTVGFDRLFTMLDSLGQPEQAQSYPHKQLLLLSFCVLSLLLFLKPLRFGQINSAFLLTRPPIW
jgi:hypothetical protein